ncbi:hypothetical protein M3D75_06990 [Microbacterium enclense]|uniref:hypothetical protein n=1 Tax=Microbacterium enclense TaxID=993073 RepID=UPI0021A6988D|nr:hypothetical protein [Microbacterium enclense]MCT2085855.1 hypothetical protein [Microbacterium enclense]
MSPQETASGQAGFDQAREANLEFKATVAEVQKQIFDGEWAVAEYGDTPQRCDQGYEFFLRRNLPDGFSFDGQGPQRMDELRTWLSDNGWQLAPTPTYGEGIDNIVIMAGKPEAKVSRLDVDMIPGVAAEGTVDVLELRATSTCEPGDAAALLEELRGPLTAVPSDDGIPDLESPDATPLFERFAEG